MTTDRLPEHESWIAASGLDRRSVLRSGAYAAGFALACQPISAATIRTSDTGLAIAEASFLAKDGFAVPAYLARPATRGPAPIVVVVHEIFGLHEWVKDVCRRFARAGFCAVAPDLFARAGDAAKVADMKRLNADIVSRTPDEQVLADIDAAYAWATTQGGDGRHRGIAGFCWGGRIVWLYAAHTPDLDAGVAFYGRPTGTPTALQPRFPADVAAQIQAPVLGQYGGADKGIPVSDVDMMREKLVAAGKSPPSTITIYPGAQHGFMADYRPSYDANAATRAWSATTAWLHRYVKR